MGGAGDGDVSRKRRALSVAAGLYPHRRDDWNNGKYQGLEVRRWADNCWGLVTSQGDVVLGCFSDEAWAVQAVLMIS